MNNSRNNLRSDPHADPEGIVTNPKALVGLDASLTILVKDIAAKLEALYPGWLWAVQPDKRGGVINIFSLRLSGKYGYRLHTRRVQHDPARKVAMEAGGEILDRFKQPRRAYDRQRWQASDRYMGSVAMDISDKSSKDRRRYRDESFTEAVKAGAIKLRIDDKKVANGTYRQLIIQPSATWERD
jgi:hypothetical protein